MKTVSTCPLGIFHTKQVCLCLIALYLKKKKSSTQTTLQWKDIYRDKNFTRGGKFIHFSIANSQWEGYIPKMHEIFISWGVGIFCWFCLVLFFKSD